MSDSANQDLIFGQNYGACQLVAKTGTSGVRIAFMFGSTPYSFYSVVSTNDVPIGQFSHLVGSWDGTTLRVYINGVFNTQKTVAAVPGDSGCAFYIGGLGLGTGGCGYVGQFFNGLIDEVSYYNRALSGAEVQTLYGAGSGGKCKTAPPLILTPPASQTVQCGSNATFAVTAAGQPPLSYQWYFSSDAVPGATNSLLVLSSVSFAQAGDYSVVITNLYGSATGGPAVLTVIDTVPPTIISCASNRTLSASANCASSLPDLTGEVVAWDGSGPVTVSQNPAPGLLLGLGATNVSFTVQDSSGNASVCTSSLTVADTTAPFVLACVAELRLGFDANCQARLPDLTSTNYIVASDNCSSVIVTQAPPPQTAMPVGTNIVLLTVSDAASNQTTRAVAIIVPAEPHISVQPASLSVVVTSNASFSVTACGASPLAYQWQHAGTNLPAATNIVLALSNAQASNAGDYRVVISNPRGSITSAVATLSVLRPPVITRQPRTVAGAPGGTASFSVWAEGVTPLTYEWQRNGTPLEGQTSAGLTLTNIQAKDFATYTVAIANTDGSALSDPAVLTRAASPIITTFGMNYTTFMLTIPTEVGPTYVVEYKDSLNDPSWKVMTTIFGTGSLIPISDNGLTNSGRFYRVRVR